MVTLVLTASCGRVGFEVQPPVGLGPTDSGTDIVAADAGSADAAALDTTLRDTGPGPDDGGPRCSVELCNTADDDCDGAVDEGFDFESDVANCGMCSNACPGRPNSVAICSGGICAFSCRDGFRDCNGDNVDGCEVDIRTPADCGGCDIPCNPGDLCRAEDGVCITDCTPPMSDCDGTCVDTFADTSHCGGCGRTCAPPNANPFCVRGLCAIDTCQAGWADCDGVPPNGCERRIDTVTDCGECDSACDLNNAISACSDEGCRIVSCQGDFRDCDEMTANGCEADLGVDPENCGVCELECGVGTACVDGSCRPTE